MYKPVLSLDVSKENSIAALYLSFGEPMGKPFRVEHTPSGFASLVELLRNLELLTHKKPEVILESTGNCSRAITQNLMEAGYSVIALNLLETHEQKQQKRRAFVKSKPIRLMPNVLFNCTTLMSIGPCIRLILKSPNSETFADCTAASVTSISKHN
ncbi:hypothetical protein Tfer_3107 [Thermincola ferriacetica]|uniref:Transposase IS110-like N-terminal domain-containing protein n=1 Tax=Thermincola ferriacetica TaxID=281456 RepID=A0A0L6VYX7_9FIRM|nr:transposase [Thermincola ferriacetica]KNZ68368.1 hypothetical protein Tfer_3107 [Thermincola ferriacetica]